MDKKRVWNLYRVSTKKQTDNEDDIPMQRTACRNFVNTRPGWEITNELYEKGVSGWKKRVDERDALTEIREAALRKEFDILLVFMLDRLGRREDETPLVVRFLHEHGIEVWSVKEGHRSIESHVDKLITYIGFWQSSGESLKTSMRVKESKKQLSEQGFYQGGVAPYGYKVVETDQRHWKHKDRFIKELAPDGYESKIVSLIFDWYVNSHCGYRKIVDRLNEGGYRSRDGKPFRVNTVQRVLTNPICVGLKKYKSHGSDVDTQPYNEKLRIVPDELFNRAEEIRTKRSQAIVAQDKDGIPLAGKLLFSGLAYCGYCGAKLSGNYLYRKKESEATSVVYRYRCPLNKGTRSERHEKNIWGAKKFDKLIIDRVKSLLALLDIEKFIQVNVTKKRGLLDHKKSTVLALEKEREKLAKQLTKLNSEIANSLFGNSVFTPDQLSVAIDSVNGQLTDTNEKITALNSEIVLKSDSYYEEKNMAEEIAGWEVKFDNADDDLKKAMLARIIKRVDFEKDDVRIEFKFNFEELLIGTN